MAATAYADVSMLQDRWRPLSNAESGRASALLEQASRMCRRRWPDLDERIAAGRLSAEDVGDVVLSMVKSAMLGPEIPVDSETAMTGPFSYTRKFSNPTGDLFFAKWMIEALDPPKRRAFTGWLA